MKKTITILAALSLAFAAFANPIPPQAGVKEDRPLTEEQASAVFAATPSKIFVDAPLRKVLVFSKTTTFRHYDGIAGGNAMFKMLGEKTKKFEFTFTEDVSFFESPEKLAPFDCIVFNNTTGQFFEENREDMKKLSKEEVEKVKQRDALCRKNLLAYVASGKGAFGFHAASDAYLNSDLYPDMRELFGGEFSGHPWTRESLVTALVEDKASPLVKGLWKTGEFQIYDEIYQMGKSYDRDKCRVILRMDADKSPLKTDKQRSHLKRLDGDYALSWVSKYGKGRYFYGAFGHNKEVFMMPEVNEFYMRGLQYACGDLKLDDSPSGKASAPKVSAEFKALVQDALNGKFKEADKKKK